MATSQITPILRSVGKYTVRAPFAVVTSQDYTCVAIRTFPDMYNDGIDPYGTVYVPAGLVTGTTLSDGTLFDFNQESILGINIVSLADNSGTIIHVPDNYISSVPTTSGIAQESIILSAELGLLPVNTDLSMAIQAVKDAVSSYTGISSVAVKTSRVATTRTLTYEENLNLKRARANAVNLQTSKDAQIADLTRKLALSQMTAQTYAQILKDKNIMPKG